MKHLNRLLVAIVASLALTLPAQAQLRFGITAGVNIDKLDLKQDDISQNIALDNRTGWRGGIMLEFTAPVIGIGFDASLLYVHHDKELSLDNTTLDYVELPVNLKYKLKLPAISSIIIPFATTGPSIAMKCSGDDAVNSANIKDHKFDAAWNAGVGAELFKFLQVKAGYSWGINKLFEKVDANAQPIDIGRLNGWCITAAVMF